MQPYYNRTIRKMVIAFGNLFNDITTIRYKPDGSEDSRFKVPITYALKENYYVRLDEDPNLEKKIQLTLPRISFHLTGLQYDKTRKQITNIRNFYNNPTTNNIESLWNPVPYDFDFEISIYVRNNEDGAQIVEQILPYFAPDYTTKVNLIPELNVVKDIPVLFNDIKSQIEYEGNQDADIRVVIWTLTFTMKGYLFGPSSGSSLNNSIIKTANTNMFTNYMYEGSNHTLTMSANGYGNYSNTEIVYQGRTLQEATAKAEVLYWNSQSNQLNVKIIGGKFNVGANVFGSMSNSRHVLSSLDYTTNTPAVTVQVSVVPPTANASSDYGFSSIITEYM